MSRYDDFLDAYGERLGEAEPPRRITRGPLLTAVAAVVAVAVAAVAVLAIAPGGHEARRRRARPGGTLPRRADPPRRDDD